MFDSKKLQDHKSDYWVGGIHPKAAQYKTTLISLHNPDILATLSKLFNITKCLMDTKHKIHSEETFLEPIGL